MNQEHSQLKLQLQKQLHTDPEQVTLQTMMLSDNFYRLCFANASLDLNVSINSLHQTFQEIAMLELVQQAKQTQCQKLKETEIQPPIYSISKRYTDFQSLFEKSIKQVLLSYGVGKCEDSQELCRQVNICLQHTNKKSFWSQVQQRIPEKSDKQLREYFQKSYQRVMYQDLTDEDDKKLLKQLFLRDPDKRAAVIADEFLQVCEHQNYFKRSIVMYIINLKRK
ncbi:Hypothetical_protein [Hexamita inflata]|uniref:Hypothetical_protein n=1 Tax=Hexamita inflata TaxID=28002 RepID=A0AA86NVZ9_9EUKA|nr:Hypothetical protein HINF_LOCUS14875 [Hexamita inflata]